MGSCLQRCSPNSPFVRNSRLEDVDRTAPSQKWISLRDKVIGRWLVSHLGEHHTSPSRWDGNRRNDFHDHYRMNQIPSGLQDILLPSFVAVTGQEGIKVLEIPMIEIRIWSWCHHGTLRNFTADRGKHEDDLGYLYFFA